VYDPESGAWSSAPDLPRPMGGVTAVSGANGRIYVVGPPTGDVFTYAPGEPGWTRATTLPGPRRIVELVVRGPRGALYFFGGSNLASRAMTRVDVYVPRLDRWTRVRQMPVGRSHFAGATGTDGRIYLIGGNDARGRTLTRVDAYDPVTNRWHAAPSLPLARSFLAAATSTHSILAIGGSRPFTPTRATVEELVTG
jgi:hypothetical protein